MPSPTRFPEGASLLYLAMACAGCAAEPPVARTFARTEPAATTAAAPAVPPGSGAAVPRAAQPPATTEAVAAPGPIAAEPASDSPAREAAAPPAAETGPADELADELALRGQLASAEDPTAAAVELAGLLTRAERVDEALVVLDTALQRSRSAVLQVARAGVLRDLGRRHAAVAELRTLRTESGPTAMHPGLLFELAELEWIEGEGPAALQTLQGLAEAHANDPWVAAHRDDCQVLRTEIERLPRPRRVAVRDMLGNLRGAPLATERLAVLEYLARGDNLTAAARANVRARAVAVALGDEAAAVRARAVQLADVDADALAPFCREALGDEAPLVRRFAVGRCSELPADSRTVLLLDHLGDEADPAVWRSAYDVLRGAHPKLAPFADSDVTSADARIQRLASWRAAIRS